VLSSIEFVSYCLLCLKALGGPHTRSKNISHVVRWYDKILNRNKLDAIFLYVSAVVVVVVVVVVSFGWTWPEVTCRLSRGMPAFATQILRRWQHMLGEVEVFPSFLYRDRVMSVRSLRILGWQSGES
jgi:predicted PurR-regulated permease PerM